MKILFLTILSLLPIFQSILLGQAKLNQDEQERAIKTLSLYQHVDSIFADNAEINSHLIGEIIGEYDPTLYRKNIQHIDSVIRYGMEFIYQNSPEELLTLLEKERVNFYMHPSNILINEKKLHILFMLLYNKFHTENNDDEYYSKIIPLIEHTRQHILILQGIQKEIHPEYFEVSMDLVELYSFANKYDKAILISKELCEFAKTLDEKFYISTILMLSDLYDAANMTIQKDNCINLVKDSPYFEEVYEGYLESK